MNARKVWSRILLIAGGIAVLVGALDPLEGSVLILGGSGAVTLGTFLENSTRGLRGYRVGIFAGMAVGRGAMFVLSAFGGFGSPTSGRSMCCGLLILPYPIAWVLEVVSLAFELIRNVKHRPIA